VDGIPGTIRFWEPPFASNPNHRTTEMTLTIDLKPAEEAHLRDQAVQNGVDLETLVSDLLREQLAFSSAEEEIAALPRVVENGIFHEDRFERLEAFLRKWLGNLPSIPDEALTREALYQDHD
jgi:hypothetical protein